MRKWPKKHKRLILEVRKTPSPTDLIVPYTIFKPLVAGTWSKHYDVTVDENRVSIQVTWDQGKPPRPAYLEFYCSFDRITGVGFSESKEGIEQYTLEGPCGGCFFLCADIPSKGSKSVIVENWGHQRKNKEPYHFGLWLKKGGQVHVQVFDPEIYNDGSIHEPPPKKPEKGKGD